MNARITKLTALFGLAACLIAQPASANTELRCTESGIITYYSIGDTKARMIDMNYPNPGEITIVTEEVLSATPTEFRLAPADVASLSLVIRAIGPVDTLMINGLNPKTHKPSVTVINRITGEIALEDQPDPGPGVCVPAEAKF
jgi:hypothetical protein